MRGSLELEKECSNPKTRDNYSCLLANQNLFDSMHFGLGLYFILFSCFKIKEILVTTFPCFSRHFAQNF